MPDAGDVTVHRIEPRFAIGNAPLLPELARLDGFDVVHLHYPFIFGSELTLLARLRRSRRAAALIVHYKNRLVGGGRRGALFEIYERTVAPTLIRAADRVLVLSEDHAQSVSYLRRALQRTPERLVELPNGVDIEAFSPGPDRSGHRHRLGIPEGAVVAAFVATLDRAHHFKRLDLAIEALARAGSQDLHLLVAGGGELLKGFKAQAVARGVDDRVHFLGRVPHPDLPDVLRASDLFLLTTEPPESFGIVLIEAFAAALPAIATDYPGVAAVVDDGETGLLVPAGDVEGVATALDGLVALGPEGRAEMGLRCRRVCEERWAWPALLDRIEAAYEQAIEARRAKLGGR